MTTTSFKPGRFGVTLGPRVLQQLRAALERDTGLQAASYLQEAGFAGGEGLYAAYGAWLSGELRDRATRESWTRSSWRGPAGASSPSSAGAACR